MAATDTKLILSIQARSVKKDPTHVCFHFLSMYIFGLVVLLKTVDNWWKLLETPTKPPLLATKLIQNF